MTVSKVVILTSLIALSLLLIATDFTSQNPLWTSWKQQQAISFPSEIDLYRKIIFLKNYHAIIKHNQKEGKTYELGLNQFSHLSSEQFDQMISSKKVRNIPEEIIGGKVEVTGPIPNDIDWEKQGKVSPVKSQGQCDAGYAFCSNSLGQSYGLMKNDSQALSEQNVVDCSADYTTFGCSSGSRSGTLKFLQEKGVTTEAKYPWVGTKQTCKNITSSFKLTQAIVTANGCNELKAQLLVSPLTVAVNTTNWQFYRSGILQNCGSEVNHDTFLVGFSETAWRLKNSWGVKWGEYGYIRLRMGDTCGICSKPGFGFKL